MANPKFIIESLSAMAQATQASLKILQGKIEYRKVRNLLMHTGGSDGKESIDVVLQRISDLDSSRKKLVGKLIEALQMSGDSYLLFLESITSPVSADEISLSERQIELYTTAYTRDKEDLQGKVSVQEERINSICERLNSLQESDALQPLISKLKEWTTLWNGME